MNGTTALIYTAAAGMLLQTSLLVLVIVRLRRGWGAGDSSAAVSALRSELAANREDAARSAKSIREELGSTFTNFSLLLDQKLELVRTSLDRTSADIQQSSQAARDAMAAAFTELSRTVGDRLEQGQRTAGDHARTDRAELAAALEAFGKRFEASVEAFNTVQRENFTLLLQQQERSLRETREALDSMRGSVSLGLKAIQDDSSAKLEKIRETVDEKLQHTLEARLGESFRLVSDRLEQVQKGLGEMQSLANGVGDLKRVLSNVKTRGVLGECQLEGILEQILTPHQYARNVKTKGGSGDMVEFAVKIPGKGEGSEVIWLPVDAKFPSEDYERLMDAWDRNDLEAIGKSQRDLVRRVKQCAKEISGKYLDPPATTDFAIMFLPFEGLYAEVLRVPGLFDSIQREFRVTITGPTTLSAFLSSLQMGFRTLAVERRTSEIWELLQAVRAEFGTFGTVLEKTRDRLNQASRDIDQASRRSRVIERKLRSVEALPEIPSAARAIESAEAGSSERETEGFAEPRA